jgi:outer membrane protein assembly factor BamB
VSSVDVAHAGSTWFVLLLATLCCACGPAERTVVVHEPQGDGARAVWAVDFIREFTIPENYRYRTEEYGSAAADPARGLVYIGSRDGTLLALDDRRGQFVWELEVGGGLSSVPILVVVNPEQGTAHIAGPDERPDWMLTGTDDGAMTAIDLETREVVWRYRTAGLIRTPAVLGDDIVYFANSRDEIFAVSLLDGDWVWQFTGDFQKDFTVFGRAGLALLPPGDHEDIDLIGDTGVVYTGLSDGKVIALDAVGGAIKWVEPLAPLDGTRMFVDVDTTPIIDVERGELLVANQTSGVYSLSLADGARRWNTAIRAVGALAEAPGGVILAASSLEGLFGLERDGRVRWHQQVDPGSLAEPLVVGSTAFVAHSDIGLLVFATGDGELLARFFNGSGSPDFDETSYRLRAIDFDQQSYEGNLKVYQPNFYIENNPIILLGMKCMEPATTRQYQQEERALIRHRAKAERERLRALLDCMRLDELAPDQHIERLRAGLLEHYRDQRFERCQTMGALVEASLSTLGWEF